MQVPQGAPNVTNDHEVYAMRGHVARKGNRYYAVVYEGFDPATGQDRHR